VFDHKEVEKKILDLAHSASEAEEIVKYLSSVNWDRAFFEKEQKQQFRELKEEQRVQDIISRGGGYCTACLELAGELFPFYQECIYVREPGKGRYCLDCIFVFQKECDMPASEWLRRCGECRKVFPFKELKQHDRIEIKGWGYCVNCLPLVIDRASIVCRSCGQKTLDYTHISYPQSLCKICYVKPPLIQAVLSNNYRAKAMGLAATLTDEQWENALNHFEYKCAYCASEPYQVLEHFTPLIAMIYGTSIDNCVPACITCNARKGDRHPDTLDKLFPSANLQRIRAYLQAQ
jgi:5-methylcytosine-specific restriction endonuclease McrA